MYNLVPGDLVWIPADTPMEYENAFAVGRSKVPTFGLVLKNKNIMWENHVVVLRHDEKVSIKRKHLRKIDPTEETNGSVSRSY
tara:strand:+ start:573 stop:821 length:249 start_codon:yes stop_codon:yes gene_type:complete